MINIVIAVLTALVVTFYFGAPWLATVICAGLGIAALFLIDILTARKL